MASRAVYSHLSDPPPTGLQFLEQNADRLSQLFTAAIWPLSSVGGTGNAVTAICDPPLLAGLVQHMRFAITWAATNTSDVTLSVAGGTPVPVLAADGSALTAGAALAGSRALLEYVGSAFLVIGSGAANDNAAPYDITITTSGTWVKPTGYADDALVIFDGVGGGGGGGRANAGSFEARGGGGGGFKRRGMRYADVASSLSIIIGAAGSGRTGSTGNGTSGGNTTIGSLLTAYGGQFGGGSSSGNSTGGGGGGELGAGVTGGGRIGGGSGGSAAPTNDAKSIWGGGGGAISGEGGGAVHGGAGGGNASGIGGTSIFAGNGGSGASTGTAEAGVAPGGGGGAGGNNANGGNGARGEVRIRILG